jgi:hypothetical protein
MLKFFFRRLTKKLDNSPDIPYNEQHDPYLERIVQELLLSNEKITATITESIKLEEKEIK